MNPWAEPFPRLQALCRGATAEAGGPTRLQTPDGARPREPGRPAVAAGELGKPFASASSIAPSRPDQGHKAAIDIPSACAAAHKCVS